MRPFILSLTVLLATIPAAAAADAEGGTLAEKTERARTLFKKSRYSEAAALAREVFVQQRDGRASDELRVLLCKAKTAGKDVGDSSTAYRGSAGLDGPDTPLAPEKISGAQPRFRRARRTDRPGEMIITAVIDEDGCLQDLKVERGLNPQADEDALEAFRDWVFRPGTLYGIPVRVPTEWEVNVRFGPG